MAWSKGAAWPHEWRVEIKALAEQYFKVGAAALTEYLGAEDSPSKPLKDVYAGLPLPSSPTGLRYPFGAVYSLRGEFGPATQARRGVPGGVAGEAVDIDRAMFYIGVGPLTSDWSVMEAEAVEWIKPVKAMFYDHNTLNGAVVGANVETYQLAPVMKVGNVGIFGIGFPMAIQTLRKRINR